MEPLGLIGATLSIIGAVDSSYSIIKKLSGLPKAFDAIENDLPLVQAILVGARTRLEGPETTNEQKAAASSALVECRNKARKLDQIFSDLKTRCSNEPDIQTWDKARGWYTRALKGVNAHRVEQLMQEILETLRNLAGLHIFVGMATIDDMRKLNQAVAELANTEPSVADSATVSAGNTSSPMQITTGDNAQQVYASSGGVHNNGQFSHGIGAIQDVSGGTFNFDFRTHNHFTYPSGRPKSPPQRITGNIPFRRDPDFIPRGNILDEIHRGCSEPAGRAALVGIGGIGKSQLAIEYAHRVQDSENPRFVFWLRADTAQWVEESFHEIADLLKIPGHNQPNVDVLKIVHNWLGTEFRERWLMIIENADDESTITNIRPRGPRRHLADFLPQTSNGSILLNTRNRTIARKLVGSRNVIEVRPMTRFEAVSLFETRLGPDHLHKTTKSDSETLVEALGMIPLAIHHAATSLVQEGFHLNAAEYVARIGTHDLSQVELLLREIGDVRRDGEASSSVIQTWQMSFESIRAQRPSAASLLALLSFFAQQGIPESLLMPPNVVGCAICCCSGNSSLGLNEGADISQDLNLLRDYGMISFDQTCKEVEMHRLVRLSTQWWVKSMGLADAYRDEVLWRMRWGLPTDNGQRGYWTTWRNMLPHVLTAVAYGPREDSKFHWTHILQLAAWYEFHRGQYKDAEEVILLALLYLTSILGDTHLDVITLREQLVSVYERQERWQEAEELIMQSIFQRSAIHGSQSVETLTCQQKLVCIYTGQNRLLEAEALAIYLRDMGTSVLGQANPTYLKNMRYLARIWTLQNRWDEAAEVYRQLQGLLQTVGAEHPESIDSCEDGAMALASQGLWNEAGPIFSAVLQVRTKLLGWDNRATRRAQFHIICVWYVEGRKEYATRQLRSCVQDVQDLFGPNDQDVETYRKQLLQWEAIVLT